MRDIKPLIYQLGWAGLAVLILICILLFGLKPKGFRPGNPVKMLPNEHTLAFSKHGMAYVEDMAYLRQLETDKGITISLAVKARRVNTRRFYSLLMLHDGNDRQQLLIGQWGSSVVVMNGDDYNHSQRRSRLFYKNVFSPQTKRIIAITSDHNGTNLYIDGKLVRRDSKWQLTVPRQRKYLQMVVGNSVTGKNSWIGDMYGIAIYTKALSGKAIDQNYQQWLTTGRFHFDTGSDLAAAYTFDTSYTHRITDQSGHHQSLWVPAQSTVLQKTFLKPPWKKFKLNFSTLWDVQLNFIGFMPLGAVLLALLTAMKRSSQKGVAPAIIGFCFLVSLSIELLQAWLPTRDSSLLDLTLNTMGAWTGVWLALRFFTRRTATSE